MRKATLLISIFLLLFVSSSESLLCAGSQLGIKAGWLNAWSEFSQDLPGVQIESITRMSGGVFIWFQFGSGRFGIQPEILYSTRGFDIRETYLDQDISSIYSITYIEIPVLLSCRLLSHKNFEPVLLAGFQIGLPRKVKESQTVDGQTEERQLGDNLKNTDAEMVIGFDLKYKLKPFYIILAARYQWGLNSISRDIQAVSYEFDWNDTIKNRSLSLMLGLAIKL